MRFKKKKKKKIPSSSGKNMLTTAKARARIRKIESIRIYISEENQ